MKWGIRVAISVVGALLVFGVCWGGLALAHVLDTPLQVTIAIFVGGIATAAFNVWIQHADNQKAAMPMAPPPHLVPPPAPSQPGPHSVTVGKTQLAAAYARQRIADAWQLVAWLDATSRDSLVSGLQRVASELQAAREVSLVQPGEDAAATAKRLKSWLETCEEPGLLVFDNATEADTLRPFLPATGPCQVVITSTNRALTSLGTPVWVGRFRDDEGLDYLRAVTGRSDKDGARLVGTAFAWLPLALAQAAALIASEGITYRDYLDQLEHVDLDACLPRSDRVDYPRGLPQAVILSVERLPDRCVRMLELICVLSDTGVSRRLLHAAAEDGETPADVNRIIGALHDASLISFIGDDTDPSSALSAHRLVTRVLRERAAKLGLLQPLTADTIDILDRLTASARQADARNNPWLMELANHICALNTHAAKLVTDPVAYNLDTLHWRAASMLQDQGAYDQAVALLEQTLADRRRVLGPDHPDTKQTERNLERARAARPAM